MIFAYCNSSFRGYVHFIDPSYIEEYQSDENGLQYKTQVGLRIKEIKEIVKKLKTVI